MGVPATWGRSKYRNLAYMKGRLLEKIQGWKQSTISQASSEVLVKAVAQAILQYPMNLFKFPDAICNELDSMITVFWWGKDQVSEKFVGFLYKFWGF